VSVWWRRRSGGAEVQQRQTGLPGIPLDSLLARIRTSASYADVQLTTAESALQAVAVWATADLIASLCSELPVDVFRGSGSDRKRLGTPWWLEDPDGDGHGLEDWRYRVMMSWLLRGNAYGHVLERSPSGFLRQVDLFHPDQVSVSVEDGRPRWAVAGQDAPRDFLHRRVNPVAGYVLGLSPIHLAAVSVGVQLSSVRYGAQWFADGAHPNALLTNSEVPLDDKQIRAVKDKFLAALRGTREPLVYGKGWDYKPIQVTPEESQFLQTQGYSAAECCRLFGPGYAEILGYESGGSLTYSNVVDRDLHLLKYSLDKWLRRLERLLSEFLPRPQYVRLNRDALLATSTMQRYQAHASALQNRWRTVNEIRDLEDLPPVPWGDEPLVGDGPSAPSDPAAVGGAQEEE